MHINFREELINFNQKLSYFKLKQRSFFTYGGNRKRGFYRRSSQSTSKYSGIQEIFTKESYTSYSKWVYSTQANTSRIIDTYGIYPRTHFLVGTNSNDVIKAIVYGYCGNQFSRQLKNYYDSTRPLLKPLKNFEKVLGLIWSS